MLSVDDTMDVRISRYILCIKSSTIQVMAAVPSDGMLIKLVNGIFCYQNNALYH